MQKPTDTSLRDYRGQTPLHVFTSRAVRDDSISILLGNLLITCGVRADDVNIDGNNPHASWF